MRALLFASSIAAAFPLRAQLLERSTQFSYQNEYGAMARWNDSLWAFAGDIHQLNSEFAYSQLRVIDTTGTERWSLLLQVPAGSEVTQVHAVAPRTGDTLIVAGYANEVCGSTNDHGFLTAYAPNGDSLWTRLIGTQAITALACPSGMILCARENEVLVLDADGDSVTSATSPFGNIHRMRTQGNRALVVASGGVMIMDSVAQVILSRPFAAPDSALDFVAYADSGFAVATPDSVFRTNTLLNTVDTVNYDWVGQPVTLAVDLGYLWVLGNDTARFFDNVLQPALDFPMKAAVGYLPTDFAVATDVIMSAGEFRTGSIVSSAAIRSVDKHGDVPPVDADAALTNLQHFETLFTPWPGVPGSYSVEVTVRANLYNYSSVDLTSVTLNYFDPISGFTCNPSGRSESTGGWTLAPGNFVQVLLGGIVDSVSISDPTISVCLRVSTPNGIYMDTDTSNDETCAVLELPVGIAEGHRATWHLVPNPATDQIFIPSSFAMKSYARYRISDQLGREVQRGTIGDGRVPVDRLLSGGYTFWLEGITAPARFIKAE